MIAATLVLVTFGVVIFLQTWASPYGGQVGLDLGHYLDGTRRWISTGTPYLASEVAGPFDYQPLTFLHPPVSLWLFAPFLVLPAPLWWAIPWTITATCIVGWRPRLWAWPLMASALAWPRFTGGFIVGNTDMWVTAFLALGLRFGWPLALVAVKPTFAVLAVLGLRDRRAWIGAVVVLIACLPFGALWIEWFAVARNAPGGLTYSLESVPTVILPVWAWLASTRTQPPRLPWKTRPRSPAPA